MPLRTYESYAEQLSTNPPRHHHHVPSFSDDQQEDLDLVSLTEPHIPPTRGGFSGVWADIEDEASSWSDALSRFKDLRTFLQTDPDLSQQRVRDWYVLAWWTGFSFIVAAACVSSPRSYLYHLIVGPASEPTDQPINNNNNSSSSRIAAAVFLGTLLGAVVLSLMTRCVVWCIAQAAGYLVRIHEIIEDEGSLPEGKMPEGRLPETPYLLFGSFVQ